MENSHWLLVFLKTNLYFTNYMYMPSGHTCQSMIESGHYIHIILYTHLLGIKI